MSTRIPDDVDIDARLAEVRDNLLATVPTTRTPRFSRAGRVGIAITGAGAIAVALTAGAIAVAQASHEEVAYSVQCYDRPSLSAVYTTVGVAAATKVAPGSAARESTDPVATCADMWRMGILGQKSVPDDPNAANFPIPELVGCTLPNGVGAGFPRAGSNASAQEFCSNLGLAIWSS